jgi:apolipoprotein N-acyltransferase
VTPAVALPPWARIALAAGAGLTSTFALRPWGWWPLGPLALAVLYVLLEGRPTGPRWWTAFAYGVGAQLVGLWWMTDLTWPGYLVSVPVLAAVVVTPTVCVPARGRWRPAAFPAAWLLGEAWRLVWPFGGVPMSLTALGQVDAPWADTARVSGALLLAAATAAVGAALGEAYLRRWVTAAVTLAAVAASTVLGVVAPDGRPAGTIEVAAVQGGGPLGTRAVDTSEADVFDRQVAATEAGVAPGADLVLWPETVGTVTLPLTEDEQYREVAALAARHDATFVVGLNERPPDRSRLNVALAVAPDGTVVDRYVKVHLVPFGEYVPLRSIVEPFADLSAIGTEITPGTGPTVLQTDVATLAPAVSFEIYFGERVRDGVRSGAEIVVNPTLASSYRTTIVPEQTLAAGRLRAIETGRWVVQASTTGYSSIIDHRGNVLQRTGLSEAATVQAEVERRHGLTWSVRLGKVPLTLLAAAVLAAGLVASLLAARRTAAAGGTPAAGGGTPAAGDEGPAAQPVEPAGAEAGITPPAGG